MQSAGAAYKEDAVMSALVVHNTHKRPESGTAETLDVWIDDGAVGLDSKTTFAFFLWNLPLCGSICGVVIRFTFDNSCYSGGCTVAIALPGYTDGRIGLLGEDYAS